MQLDINYYIVPSHFTYVFLFLCQLKTRSTFEKKPLYSLNTFCKYK